MELNDFKRVNRYFVAFEILLFNLFGLFGNSNFILLTLTRRNLRSKSCKLQRCSFSSDETLDQLSAFLQCVLSFFHIFCLVFEIPNAILLILDIKLNRNVCFSIIFPYIFFICAQAVIFLMLVLDLYVILFLPTVYRLMSTGKYLIYAMILPISYGLFVLIWGYQKIDEEIIMFCNPPLSLHPTVSRFWSLSNVILNTVVLMLLIGLIVYFHFEGKAQKKETKRKMNRLKASIIIFVFTWYLGLFGVDLFSMIGLDEETRFLFVSNMVFFVLLSYTQTFYTFLWRSHEYRHAFFSKWTYLAALTNRCPSSNTNESNCDDGASQPKIFVSKTMATSKLKLNSLISFFLFF